MSNQNIKCPNCGTDIELTEVLTGQIEQGIKAKYQAEALEQEKAYKVKADELAKQAEAIAQQKAQIDSQVADKVKAEKSRLAEAEKTLASQKEDFDRQIAETLKAERKALVEAERQKILAEQSDAMTALNEELATNKKKLSEANKKELEMLKKQSELEEARENLELEVQRKLTEERKKIAEDASQKAAEQQMLKMREKDDQIAAMLKQIDDMKRRAELGSQEAQGEALECELKEYLERSFPYDRFTEVKKGARGADVVQTVCNSTGAECGIILWESKNTKDFQKSWIPKLKGDQQDANADIAVIMSVALPTGIKGFGLYEDIWVSDYASTIGLATALRQGLIDANRQKAITAGRDSIKDVIYNYITSQEFALHIKAVATAYTQMKDDLEAEKRAMTRIWKKREKQISSILENVSGMYGSIEGIVGSQKALPGLDVLSLDSIAGE